MIYLQRAELNRETVCTMHPSSIHGVEDMSTLAELHEAAIMHNLFLRYQRDNIYVRHHTVSVCAHTHTHTTYHHDVPGIYGPCCVVQSSLISEKWHVQHSLTEISKHNKSPTIKNINRKHQFIIIIIIICTTQSSCTICCVLSKERGPHFLRLAIKLLLLLCNYLCTHPFQCLHVIT